MHKIRNNFFLLILLLTAIILAACASQGTVIQTTQTTAGFRQFPPTWTPLSTQTPLPLLTFTPTTTEPLPTATLLPTLEPLPTLPTDEAQSQVVQLLNTNGDCAYPCWWGITPGTTSWAQARNFLESFSLEIGAVIVSGENTDQVSGFFYPRFSVPTAVNPQEKIEYKLSVEQGVVEVISGESIHPVSWFLNTYGKPAAVWVRTLGVGAEGRLDFHLALYYPEQRIAAIFTDQQATSSATQITGCFGHSPQVMLWSEKADLTFEDIPLLGTGNWKTYPSLEQATGYTIQQFTQTFRDVGQPVCLTTSKALWDFPYGDGFDTDAFTVSYLIAEYGEPDEILVDGYLEDGIPVYDLAFNYAAQQILITYEGQATEIDDELYVCLNPPFEVQPLVWTDDLYRDMAEAYTESGYRVLTAAEQGTLLRDLSTDGCTFYDPALFE